MSSLLVTTASYRLGSPPSPTCVTMRTDITAPDPMPSPFPALGSFDGKYCYLTPTAPAPPRMNPLLAKLPPLFPPF